MVTIEEKLTELGANIERLRDTDEWTAWLRTAARFHAYSLNNQLLIWAQRPDATRVAGYRTWQGLGRQVRKGEKGIRILAPATKKVEQDDGTHERKVFFRTVAVFDVAQTEGDPLPEHPDWPFAGGDPDVLFADVVEQATAMGFDISLVPGTAGGPRGWCYPARKEIAITVHMSDAAQLAVLLHELGHCFDPDVATDHSRKDKELVAESVAYLVGTGLGLDMEAQVHAYLTSWQGDTKSLLEVAGRVSVAVKSIHELLATPIEVAA